MRRAVVIIPTYNERDNLPVAVAALLHVFASIDDWRMEILVVDDTSPDKTYEVAAAMAEEHDQVTLLLNHEKCGLGGAYLRGMEHAFGEMAADVVFEFDADLSHDATRIPIFLEAVEGGADLVLGSRYVPGGGIPGDWPLLRRFLSVAGNLIIMTVLGNFKVRDWTTGFRAIRREVYDAVAPRLRGKRFSGYTFNIGFLYEAVKAGFTVVEVPLQFVDRTRGQSKLGPEYLKNTLAFIFRARLNDLVRKRWFKFAVVGGTGAVLQLLWLQVWWAFLPYQMAVFLSIETAVVSNFILNNLWTFSDRRLRLAQVPLKFLTFNAAAVGSIAIQQTVAALGEYTIGLHPLFSTPFLGLGVNTGEVFAVVGIVLGMFLNFFVYNRYIWKGAARSQPELFAARAERAEAETAVRSTAAAPPPSWMGSGRSQE
jgi:dolichol-phosphate mannosyltransferase